MWRVVFHLLEDPSALLYTHYVSFTLYYKYPAGWIGSSYICLQLFFHSQSDMNEQKDLCVVCTVLQGGRLFFL